MAAVLILAIAGFFIIRRRRRQVPLQHKRMVDDESIAGGGVGFKATHPREVPFSSPFAVSESPFDSTGSNGSGRSSNGKVSWLIDSPFAC